MTKKKLTFIIINKNVINVFLINHLKILIKYYDINFISPINSSYIKIENISFNNKFLKLNRDLNFFNFLNCFLSLLFHIKKNKNHLFISIHPKNGLLLSICKYFQKFISLHIITGQVWTNMRGLKKIIFKYIDNLIFKKNDYLLIDSNSQISYLKKHNFNYKFDCINYGSICGVNLNTFKKSKLNKIEFKKKYLLPINSKFILFIGRINASKGIDLLLKAFDLIRKNNEDYYLLIVGRDEMSFDNLINKYSTNLKNKILKFDHTADVAYFYSLADIFCLPSYREGFGLSVIEASASSLPVIVSDIYGLQDSMIDKVTGLKFKTGDYNSLYHKINYLIQYPSQSEKFGVQGKAFVKKNFDHRDVTNFLLKYLNKIVF